MPLPTEESPIWQQRPPVPPARNRHAAPEPEAPPVEHRVRYERESNNDPLWRKWWVWLIGFLTVCVIMGNLAAAFGSDTQVIVPPSTSCDTTTTTPVPTTTPGS